MVAKQVKFRCPDADTIESRKDVLGGIAVYEGELELDKTPQYIISGNIFLWRDIQRTRRC